MKSLRWLILLFVLSCAGYQPRVVEVSQEEYEALAAEEVPIECQDTPGKALVRFAEGFNNGMNPNGVQRFSPTERQYDECERAKDRLAQTKASKAVVDAINNQKSGCKSDNDCKGDRICEQGVCVVPLKHCNEVQSGPCHTD